MAGQFDRNLVVANIDRAPTYDDLSRLSEPCLRSSVRGGKAILQYERQMTACMYGVVQNRHAA